MALRLSEVDPAKGQQEFAAAVADGDGECLLAAGARMCPLHGPGLLLFLTLWFSGVLK